MPMPTLDAGRHWYDIHAPATIRALVRVPSPDITHALQDRLTAALRRENVPAGYDYDSSAVVTAGSIVSAVGPMTHSKEVAISGRLGWISLVVLLIACANVANLWTTRFVDRRREIAVRLALGISRRRLMGQVLIETLTLAGLALGAALMIGAWAGRVLRVTLLPGVHWTAGVMEWRVVLGVALAATVAAALIAVAPVAYVDRLAGIDALTSAGRSAPNVGRRARHALAMGQTALAVLLLMGAGLFIQSLRRVLSVDTGYDVDRIIYASPVMLGDRGGEDNTRSRERGTGLIEAARRLGSIPGIQSVALTSNGPMAGYYMTVMSVPGIDSLAKVLGGEPSVRDVSPEYWRTIGLAAVRGRVTSDHDVQGGPLVVVVTETMARLAWPGPASIPSAGVWSSAW
jgi:hypothetical protein